MQVQNSKYHKCWESENKGKFTKIKFGDSKKDKEGNYVNCTWSGILVGKAHETGISKDEKFNIISGQVFQDKVEDKYYTNVVIFEIEATDRVEKKEDDFSFGTYEETEIDSDLPF